MSPTGHLAIGFAAKKYAPQIPVVVFLIATYAIDLIYFVFLQKVSQWLGYGAGCF